MYSNTTGSFNTAVGGSGLFASVHWTEYGDWIRCIAA